MTFTSTQHKNQPHRRALLTEALAHGAVFGCEDNSKSGKHDAYVCEKEATLAGDSGDSKWTIR
jgi:hypothetical protein